MSKIYEKLLETESDLKDHAVNITIIALVMLLFAVPFLTGDAPDLRPLYATTSQVNREYQEYVVEPQKQGKLPKSDKVEELFNEVNNSRHVSSKTYNKLIKKLNNIHVQDKDGKTHTFAILVQPGISVNGYYCVID